MEYRTEKISFRVTPTELKYIKNKFKDTSYNMSEFARTSVLDKNIIIIEDLKYITNDLKGISRNLNQALMLAHKGYIKEVDIEPTKKQVEEIWQLLNSLMVKMKK